MQTDQHGTVLNGARQWPPVPSYDALAFNLLAAAIYNARHADQPPKSWDEIAANEITRNFYTDAARRAMRACFPTENY